MIGLVIVAQGGLAAELRAALEHVVGPQRQIELLSVGATEDVEGQRTALMQAVDRADDGDGVVILTDMFEAPGSEVATSMINSRDVELISGVNLPMLIKLATIRCRCPLSEAVVAAQESGRKYITHCTRPAARLARETERVRN